MVISDGRSHFIDAAFRSFLKEVQKVHVATPYHPKTSGQEETSNKKIKSILQKIIDKMGKAWRPKLADALLALLYTVQDTH